MCCWSLQAPCLTAIVVQGHLEQSYAKLTPFMLQAHLSIPKHPMVHGHKCLAMQENMQMHSNVCADYTTEGKTPVLLH